MAETIERRLYLEKRRKRYAENKERITEQNLRWYRNNKERVLAARKKYKEDNAEKTKQQNREYNARMKATQSEKAKLRRRGNEEEMNKASRERRANRTPEQRAKEAVTKKRYDEANAERLSTQRKLARTDEKRLKRRELHHKRYRTDPKYKILHNLRSRVKQALRKSIKATKSHLLLGCGVDFFHDYIRGQFTEGMTWELFMSVKIHVDHIKPCSKFNLEDPEEQKACFHYTNLQPLWELDNLRKGASYNENEKICQRR